MCWSLRSLALHGLASVSIGMVAGCAGSKPASTAATVEGPPPTSTFALDEPGPTTTESVRQPSVIFDGESCALGTTESFAPGLINVSVLNTTPSLTEAIFGQVAPGATIDDVAAEVSAGDYDDFGDRGPDWQPPPSLASRNPIVMPRRGSEATAAGFVVTTGTWVVLCVDLTEGQAFMAPETFEIR